MTATRRTRSRLAVALLLGLTIAASMAVPSATVVLGGQRYTVGSGHHHLVGSTGK